MLDVKSKLVLKILNKECPNGAYKIVDSADIISALPNKYKMDYSALEHILNYLERQDCISIKYDDDNIYCICVLPFGCEICENVQKEKKPNKLSPIVYFIIVFILSLLASFISNLLAKLIVI